MSSAAQNSAYQLYDSRVWSPEDIFIALSDVDAENCTLLTITAKVVKFPCMSMYASMNNECLNHCDCWYVTYIYKQGETYMRFLIQ